VIDNGASFCALRLTGKDTGKDIKEKSCLQSKKSCLQNLWVVRLFYLGAFL
jgi:hypothetical protein